MIYYNGNIKEIHYSGFTINKVYSCGGELVWQAIPPSPKFIATYSDSSSYSAACDDNTSLTIATTKPSGYQYSAMTSAVIGDCITDIGEGAFRYCSALTGVTIPSGVTTIGIYAFANCSGLTSIDIPSGVTSIGDSVFRDCNHLTSITIPSGVTTIGNYAFYGCSGLTSIDIPSGVTTIENHTFTRCYNLTSVDMSNGITTIGDWAFGECSGLTSVDIPNSVTTIGYGAFMETGLSAITIPDSVTTISGNSLYDCTGLTSITCNAITPPTLGSFAFLNTNNCPIYVPCQSLEAYKTAWSEYESRIQCVEPPVFGEKWLATYSDSSTASGSCESSTTISQTEIPKPNIVSLVVGDCCTVIDGYALYNCSGLTSFTIGSGVTNIGFGAFQNCVGLTTFDIPDGVAIIRQDILRGCRNITTCTVGSGVTYIENSAFSGCSSLTSITLPSGVTNIGSNVFNGCTSLNNVTIYTTTPPRLDNSNAFSNTNNCPIYVPDASVSAYKSANVWSNLSSRIKGISEKP